MENSASMGIRRALLGRRQLVTPASHVNWTAAGKVTSVKRQGELAHTLSPGAVQRVCLPPVSYRCAEGMPTSCVIPQVVCRGCSRVRTTPQHRLMHLARCYLNGDLKSADVPCPHLASRTCALPTLPIHEQVLAAVAGRSLP